MFKMLAQDAKSTFCSWLCHKKICDLRRLNLAFLCFDFPSFLRMETVVPPRGILRNVFVLSAFPRVQPCEPSQRSAQGPFTLSERLLTNLHLFHHHLQCPDSGVICSCPNPYPVSMQQFWNPSGLSQNICNSTHFHPLTSVSLPLAFCPRLVSPVKMPNLPLIPVTSRCSSL